MFDFSTLDHDEARLYRDAYVQSLPGLVDRLERRADRTDGPEPDGTLESLRPLGAWFTDQLDADPDDGMSGRPAWSGDGRARSGARAADRGGRRRRRLSDSQLRLVDETGAYLGLVLGTAVPGARWVVRCSGPRAPGGDQHRTVLQSPGWTLEPAQLVHDLAAAHVLQGRSVEPGSLWRSALDHVASAGRGTTA